MIDLVFQNFTSDKSFKGQFFKKILSAGIGELGLKDKSIEVSLSLVDQSKIRELNKQYRNKDKATDVLSFPMSEKSPSNNLEPSNLSRYSDLGDIFICLPVAKNDAKSENVSIENKLAQLTVHGFLHLAGYDHEVSKQAEIKMFKLQNNILHKLNL